MKFLRLIPLLVMLPLSGMAADRITALVQFASNPAAADTFTVNGDVRTWRTSPTMPASEITRGATIGASATNLYQQILAYPYTGPISVTLTNGTNLVLVGSTAQALAVTASYCVITYSTQSVSIAYTLRVPGSAEAPSVRAYNFSQAVTAIDTYSTNSFSQTTTALLNHVNLSNVQTVGNKTFTNSTFKGGWITNYTELGLLNWHYSETNAGLTTYDSVGSQKYAVAPGPSGQPSIWNVSSPPYLTILTNPAAYNPLPESILNFNIATNRFGQLSKENIWTGTNAFTRITNSAFVNGTITNTTFAGTIVALSAGVISGTVLTSPTTTNLTTYGTNTLNGTTTFPRVNYTSLANGNNAGVDFGDYVFVKIKPGPTAAFTINGIAKGRDGRRLLVYNNTTNNCTIANDSGTDPTPANRILTLTGADVVSTGDSFFGLIYDSDASRWILTGSQL